MAASTGGGVEDGAPAARPRPRRVPGSNRGTLRPPRPGALCSMGTPPDAHGFGGFPSPGQWEHRRDKGGNGGRGGITWGHLQVGKRCTSLPGSLHNASPNRRVRSRQGHPWARGAGAEREKNLGGAALQEPRKRAGGDQEAQGPQGRSQQPPTWRGPGTGGTHRGQVLRGPGWGSPVGMQEGDICVNTHRRVVKYASGTCKCILITWLVLCELFTPH